MDLAEFAKMIKSRNEHDSRWWILMLVVIFPFVIFTNGENKLIEDVGVKVYSSYFSMLLLFVVTTFFAVDFSSQYLKVRTSEKLKRYLTTYGKNKSVVEITRMHSFDIKEYFSFIQKKILKWQMIILIYLEVLGIVKKDIKMILGGVIAGCIPIIVLFIRKKLYEYDICHRQGIFAAILFGILEIIQRIAEFLFVLVVYFITVLMIWAVFSGILVKGLNENEIIYREYATTIMWVVVPILLFILSCMIYMGKRSFLIRCILFLILMATGTITAWVNGKCYTIINMSQETIEVADFDERKEYSFDDIAIFETGRNDDDEIYMSFIFENGDKVKICENNSYEYSDRFSKEYKENSVEEFVGDLKKKLVEKGVYIN